MSPKDVLSTTLPKIEISTEAMRLLRERLREEAGKDPEIAKQYTKAKSKVSSEIRTERILAENPEIKDERERKQKIRQARKDKNALEKAKLESRRLERQTAREDRKKLEADQKAIAKENFDRRTGAAEYSEEQKQMILKADLYFRENAGEKECKVLVSFKINGKYSSSNATFKMEENETEEQFKERMDNELIGLLISVKEESLI